MDMVLEGRCEQALNGMTFPVDRGYAKEGFINTLSEAGASIIVILPEHLLRCHPFVGK